jgi:RNA recognition motif-containing protein
LTEWVQSVGIHVKSIHLIQDLVTGVSPVFAYVDIDGLAEIADAVEKLNGQVIRDRVVHVSQARRAAPAA